MLCRAGPGRTGPPGPRASQSGSHQACRARLVLSVVRVRPACAPCAWQGYGRGRQWPTVSSQAVPAVSCDAVVAGRPAGRAAAMPSCRRSRVCCGRRPMMPCRSRFCCSCCSCCSCCTAARASRAARAARAALVMLVLLARCCDGLFVIWISPITNKQKLKSHATFCLFVICDFLLVCDRAALCSSRWLRLQVLRLYSCVCRGAIIAAGIFYPRSLPIG